MNIGITASSAVYSTNTTAQCAYTPVLDVTTFNNGVSSLTYTVNHHANLINKLQSELHDLKGFYHWITDTYPEHMEQYRALLDLERAGK